MTTIVDRFLKYVSFDTQSDENSSSVPSTAKQLKLAEYLVKELSDLGLADVRRDDWGYVYATLPANTPRTIPTIGFIAHMDTSPDASGADVHPRIVKDYDGKDIILDHKAGVVSRVATFPELLRHTGEDIIVTDGHTLLGADDKAGIAEIVTAMEYFLTHPEIEHGQVRVAFNPDEEIGRGPHHFDVEHFGCEWAYTMDGGEIGELEFENFNAASAMLTIHGVSVHPGYAKGKMVNAVRVGTELIEKIPIAEMPETTEGYEGFYHITGFRGTVEQATLQLIIRDHDRSRFEQRKLYLRQWVGEINEHYGCNVIDLNISDTYYNMREKIEPMMHIIDLARKAMYDAEVEPHIKAIRGGTDGAQLSFMGLPCPNIFAGGLNFHGVHEFLPVRNMEKACEVVICIIRNLAQL